MFQITELKKWAKKFGITVKKQNGEYVWFEEKDKITKADTIKDVATQIYNKITNNKFLDYQNEYKKKSALH